MAEEIVNRIAKSGILTIDLEQFYPEGCDSSIDIRDLLWQEMVLREKDLRDFVANHDWENYNSKTVAVYCSADVIIPKWAYMILAAKLHPVAREVYFGTPDEYTREKFAERLRNMNPEEYRNRIVLVKGCGKRDIPESAYGLLTMRLLPVVKSLMFGEACSTIPVYKAPRQPAQ